MSEWKKQLRWLDDADPADLLGEVLNDLHRAASRGESADAERQLDWWMRALGGDVEHLAARVVKARARAKFPAARLVFAEAQRHRRRALLSLHAAISGGEWPLYLRWRWAARAYAAAVRSFAGEELALAQLEADAPRLAREAAHEHVQQRVVLRALYAALGEACASEARAAAVRVHALERGHSLAPIVAAYEAKRERQLEERKTLRERVRALRPELADSAVRAANTLPGQLRELEQAALRAAHLEAAPHLAHTVREQSQRLMLEMGRLPAEPDDLVSGLAAELQAHSIPAERVRAPAPEASPQ